MQLRTSIIIGILIAAVLMAIRIFVFEPWTVTTTSSTTKEPSVDTAKIINSSVFCCQSNGTCAATSKSQCQTFFTDQQSTCEARCAALR